jgi:hypothetical protein
MLESQLGCLPIFERQGFHNLIHSLRLLGGWLNHISWQLLV